MIINSSTFNRDEYELSALFLELPSKKEYPDYYQIIKHPIALEDMKVRSRKTRQWCGCSSTYL